MGQPFGMIQRRDLLPVTSMISGLLSAAIRQGRAPVCRIIGTSLAPSYPLGLDEDSDRLMT
jgi:hypothetical protein